MSFEPGKGNGDVYIDLFREYPTTLLGFATGQVLNLAFSVLGLGLMLAPLWTRRGCADEVVTPSVDAQIDPVRVGLGWRRVVLAALLAFSMVMPSDWTQDVPARYGGRHAGRSHSAIYPRIATSPAAAFPMPDRGPMPVEPRAGSTD